MRSPLGSALVFGVLGLVAGYLIFGRVGGSFVPVTDLVQMPSSTFEEFGQAVRGIGEIRRNILISGAVGLGIGVLYGGVRKR